MNETFRSIDRIVTPDQVLELKLQPETGKTFVVINEPDVGSDVGSDVVDFDN